MHTPDDGRIAASDHACRATTGYDTAFDRLFTSAETQFIVGRTFVIRDLMAAGQLPVG